MMMIRVVALAGLLLGVESKRFSAILKGTSGFKSSVSTADPYGWEIQANPVSKHSCYAIDEDKPSSLVSIYDDKCVGFSKTDSKCRGGFPFYRFSGGPEGCIDCMDASRCQMMCLSKGMDAAALVLNPETKRPSECRCGATKQNMAVWSLLTVAPVDGKPSFGPVHGLLPPSVRSAVAANDPRCAMFVYLYKDEREENGGVPQQFVETTSRDDFYVHSIVSGLTDPGEVEDSTVEEMEKTNDAIRARLALWLKQNPTGRVPRDEIFVEQVAEEQQESSAASCAGIDEPFTCFDSAVDAVLTQNGWTKYAPGSDNSKFTSEYMTMMMTVSFENWQKLFAAGTDTVAVGQTNYKKAGFCAATANAEQCPITCGRCKQYDRPAQAASEYTTWLGTNKDANTGIVTIPVVYDASNQFVTATVKDWVKQAMSIWAQVTCVNFQEVTTPPQDQRYVLITALTDSTGAPTGCLADPVGLPPQGQPTKINVGGCSKNSKPLGSIIHEFGHVLGLVHTQMRPDRDQYIQMNPLMVKAGYEANFFLSPYAFDGTDGKYSAYDYGSIMHYTRTQAANSANYNANSPDFSGTFKLLQTLASGVTLGQRDALSVLDINEINTLYQCNGKLGNMVPATSSSATATTPAPTQAPTTPAGGAGVAGANVKVGTAAAPATTPTAPPAWTGWDTDIEAIADAINAVITNDNLNLSNKQLDILKDLLEQEKALYDIADKTITLQQVKAGWRDVVVKVAKTVLDLVAEARAGVAAFEAKKNDSQEGILDFAAIAKLELIVSKTKDVYTKVDAYIKTIPGAVAADASEMRRPRKKEAVVVFG